MNLATVQDFIQQFGLYMQLMACLAYILNFRRVDTFVSLCVGILLLTPSQFLFERYLLELAIEPTNKEMVRNLWYIGFAISDMVFVAIVALIAHFQNLKFDFTSKILAFSFLGMAWIQLFRYVDRIVIETDMLGEFYRASIPAINISVTIVIVVFTLGMIAADGARK
ncbi:hypothetical protein [Alteromonas facilis]|uniref:hypothetical protein n=1 Tax=Alteromonas facilis TaxID=2048004 RepID=UPI000C282CF7|nr:hypothetical protein [Alteromonas facilis]